MIERVWNPSDPGRLPELPESAYQADAVALPVEPRVAVIVPWRSTPDREPVFRWVADRWRESRFADELVAGDCPGDAWVKALAVADGIEQTDADVFVVSDADVWTEGVHLAIAEVSSGRSAWAIPHGLVYRLKPAPTADLLAGGPLVYTPVIRKPYRGWPGGGVVVLTRAAWETAPLDPRFVGWGQEDASWALALETLCGPPWRGVSPLVHLWHEPQPRMTSVYGSLESRYLWERYQAAHGDRVAMAALIGEAR